MDLLSRVHQIEVKPLNDLFQVILLRLLMLILLLLLLLRVLLEDIILLLIDLSLEQSVVCHEDFHPVHLLLEEIEKVIHLAVLSEVLGMLH
jgi:hypothetical protein